MTTCPSHQLNNMVNSAFSAQGEDANKFTLQASSPFDFCLSILNSRCTTITTSQQLIEIATASYSIQQGTVRTSPTPCESEVLFARGCQFFMFHPSPPVILRATLEQQWPRSIFYFQFFLRGLQSTVYHILEVILGVTYI